MTLDVLAFAFSVVFLVICGRSHLTARRCRQLSANDNGLATKDTKNGNGVRIVNGHNQRHGLKDKQRTQR